MPVKLLVTRTTDASSTDEYVFDQETITIGRDSASQLTLPDLKRVVSKQHAELRRQDGGYQIVDLGSKNFTYLNDERLESNRLYDVRYGDSIRIGEFAIRVEPFLPPSPDRDRTVFDVHFVNPFAEDVSQLTEALRRIRQSFDREVPSRREDALREALEEAFIADGHRIYEVIGHLLSPPVSSVEDVPLPPTYDMPAEPKSPPPAARPSAAAVSVNVPNGRRQVLVDVLVRASARLVNIPWQFRHEFIGQTIVQSAESAAVFSGDADALKEYLLDDRIPEAEAARRLDQVAQAAEEVALHQVALLDGYRASAQMGAQRLLEDIDPEAAEAAAKGEGWLNRLFPFLASSVALVQLTQKLRELGGEDWSVAERRIFRPAFIKAYLARMTSMRK